MPCPPPPHADYEVRRPTTAPKGVRAVGSLGTTTSTPKSRGRAALQVSPLLPRGRGAWLRVRHRGMAGIPKVLQRQDLDLQGAVGRVVHGDVVSCSRASVAEVKLNGGGRDDLGLNKAA